MILIRFDSKLGNAFLFATPWLLITVAVLTSAFFILLPTVHRPKRGLSPPSFPLFLPSHAEPDKFILADAVVSILIGTLFLDQIPKHLKCAADPPQGAAHDGLSESTANWRWTCECQRTAKSRGLWKVVEKPRACHHLTIHPIHIHLHNRSNEVSRHLQDTHELVEEHRHAFTSKAS